jgi:predicted  nucleic acid-binding Zn-ribbon protein
MQAPADQQRALLELQAVDSAIDRLVHRRANLPEDARLGELRTSRSAIDQLIAERDGALATTRREQERLEHEIETLSSKAGAEEARAAAGKVTSPKELTAIQAEVQGLRRRIATLEDDLLERMETRETLEAELADLAGRAKVAEAERADVTSVRDAAVAEIDGELAARRSERAGIAPRVGEALGKLYDQIRARSGGVGAAALQGDTCQGCRVSISPVELRKLRQLPPEEVRRCENCRRIMVLV